MTSTSGQLGMPSAEQTCHLLMAVQNPNADVRGPAEHQLHEWETHHFASFFETLLSVLADAGQDPGVRMMAGLVLKNSVVAKSAVRRAHLEQRWLMLPDTHRVELKNRMLGILASPVREARHLAAVLVGNVAAVEMSRNMWGELVPMLIQNIQSAQDPALKESTLETLGYVCEECPEQLFALSGQILSVIAGCIGDSLVSIRMAATKALANSLEFARANMSNAGERQMILQMIFSSLQAADAGVRLHGYSCLVKMATIYYEYLGEFLEGIFELAKVTIQTDEENVAMQAIEFWSSICDSELEITHMHLDAQSKGKQCSEPLLNIIKTVLSALVPLLLEAMTKQSEYRDADTWDKSAAAATCLTLCSQVASQDIVGQVLPFVQQHILSQDWHFREASTLAFGCILDGPPIPTIEPLVQAAFSVILQHIRDPNEQVRDSAAWTIGRMCELVPHQSLGEDHVKALMEAIVFGLAQDPRVASLMCWSVRNIIINSSSTDSYEKICNERFAPFFQTLMQNLLQASDRPDADEAHLRSAAVEALNVLIQFSPKSVQGLVEELYPVIRHRLEQSFQQTGLSQDENMRIRETQGLLCASLQVIINKRGPRMTMEEADSLMMLFLSALQNPNVTLFEEALMAIGSIANCSGEQFEKYMSATAPFIGKALRNVEDYHLNRIAVGLISDLSRSLGPGIAPFCDDIVTLFLQNLQSEALDTVVKPHIIAAIGDLAMALNGDFCRYLDYVMAILVEASKLLIEPNDLDSVDNVNELRTSILETYTGIINALGADGQLQPFLRYVPEVVALLDLVAKDPETSVDTLRAAVGVSGDLAACFGRQVLTYLALPCIGTLLQSGLSSGTPDVSDSAKWAKSVLDKISRPI